VPVGCQGEELATMRIAFLGTGFGQVHAAVYAQRPDVDEVVVFGRTAEKLAKISGWRADTDTKRAIPGPDI
jgi:predicted dehydrogenase